MNKENCMICVEECDMYLVPIMCQCKLIVHEMCLEKWRRFSEESNKCLICKETFNENFPYQKTYREIMEESFIVKYCEYLLSFVSCWIDNIISCHNILSVVLTIVISFIITSFVIAPMFLFIEITISYARIKFFYQNGKNDKKKDYILYNL